MRDDYKQHLDADADREYLMGVSRYRDEGDFIARRPHTICWRHFVAARRRRRPRTKKREG
jgi:hypothetical protein